MTKPSKPQGCGSRSSTDGPTPTRPAFGPNVCLSPLSASSSSLQLARVAVLKADRRGRRGRRRDLPGLPHAPGAAHHRLRTGTGPAALEAWTAAVAGDVCREAGYWAGDVAGERRACPAGKAFNRWAAQPQVAPLPESLLHAEVEFHTYPNSPEAGVIGRLRGRGRSLAPSCGMPLAFRGAVHRIDRGSGI
jgi:hypothetical protein